MSPIEVRDALLASLRCVNVASKLGLTEGQMREIANNQSASLTGGCSVQIVDEDEMERAA